MKLLVDTRVITDNIEKAGTLTNVPAISLMFKDFYEDIHCHLDLKNEHTIFSRNLNKSVCYSIGKANNNNSAAVIVNVRQAFEYNVKFEIATFYLPINVNDNREGLSVNQAYNVAADIKSVLPGCKIIGMVTSGCINSSYASMTELNSIWIAIKDVVESISLGGSFYLGKCVRFPNYINEIRIGEYMLFGTIPYCNKESLCGAVGLFVESEILGVYEDRKEIILDCGYSTFDAQNSQIRYNDLSFVNCSSDYAIYKYKDGYYRVGDKITFVPDYKSLVKLRNVEREYRK